MAEVSGMAVGSGTAVAAGIACPELPELGAATGVLAGMAAAGASVADAAGAAAGASPAVPQATAIIRAKANGAKTNSRGDGSHLCLIPEPPNSENQKALRRVAVSSVLTDAEANQCHIWAVMKMQS